jgi:hypothetical protein
MKGLLIKNESNLWVVKWSDLHSFGHGTHWSYTELLPTSDSIQSIKDNEVIHQPLEENLEVEFEFQTTGYDTINFTPFRYVKLIFPEVEKFKKEKLIKQYVKNNGTLWSIDHITIIRDGGTIMLVRPIYSKLKPLYIDKDNWTIHTEYPLTDTNIITDEPTITYIFDRLERHKENCEHNLKQAKRIIDKLKEYENIK